MVCKEVLRRLCDYLDGNLDPRLVEELSRHLGDCEDCNIVVDTTRKTIEFYWGNEPAPLPENFRKTLHDALARRLNRKPSQ